jgi:hypothetical protein
VAGFKTFFDSNILTATEVNGFMMQQQISVFDTQASRDALITSPVHGQFAYVKDLKTFLFFDSVSWKEL